MATNTTRSSATELLVPNPPLTLKYMFHRRSIIRSQGSIAISEKDPLLSMKEDAVKTLSDSANEETKAFQVKPRHDGTALRVHFKQQMLDLRDAPYEYYENLLYETASKNARYLHGQAIDLDAVKTIHHICELKEKEDVMTPADIDALNCNLERALEQTPAIFEEYKLITTLLKIASGLLIKWGMISFAEYTYRLNGRVVQVRPIDLFRLNSTLFSMETLWYSLMLDEQPLSAFIDVSVRQYAIVLKHEVTKALMFMLRMNEADFWETESIAGYLAWVNPELVTRYRLQPEYDMLKPEYQELRQPEGLLARCNKTKGQTNALKLKKILKDLEMSFRAFEKSLISCFMRKMLKLDEIGEV